MFNIAKTLHKKKCRDETGLFLIEGHREIELAMKHGVEIVHMFDKTNTSEKNLERISYCGEVVAVAKMRERDLGSFEPPSNPLIIALDNLEKPGNIGAIIRTADAAGVSAVFICGSGGDLGNPNLIRASLGAVFSVPVFCLTYEQAADWLGRRGIPVVVATPDAKTKYCERDLGTDVAIVVGNEADGVSDFWAEKANLRVASVTIPMTGEVNSLNVSVSAAVLIYEAVRQRGG